MHHRVPELAHRLTLHPQPDGRTTLRAPDGRQATLGLAPAALLLLVDGRRTVEIIEVVAQDLGLPAPPGALANLLLQLEHAGLVRFVPISSRPHTVLPATRHTCEGCGRSCEGHLIGPLPPSELRTIQALWPELQQKVPRLVGQTPFQRIGDAGIFLNTTDGHCLFLDPDKRCAIHRHAGPDAKPAFCRMFPIVRVLTEDGLRIGVAPRCFRHHAHADHATGPLPAPAPLDDPLAELPAPTLDRAPLPETPFTFPSRAQRHAQRRWRDTEAHLLDVLGAPDMTLPALAAHLLGARSPQPHPAPSDALHALLKHLHEHLDPDSSELRWVLDGHTGVAADLQRALDDLKTSLDTLAPPAPLPTWTAEDARWLLSQLRNALFLREPVLFPDPLPAFAVWIAGFLLAVHSARELPGPDRFDAVCTRFVAWFRLVSEAEDFELLAMSRPMASALLHAVASRAPR